ncbi:Phenylalanine--tRNA ligase beta subunit [uncultured archaeon]|nr:Phenylalanine--tRNA ligase beta subunit [uncultured archaeon]
MKRTTSPPQNKTTQARQNHAEEHSTNARTLIRPDLTPRSLTVEAEYVNRLLGLTLPPKEIVDLLKKMRYDATPDKKTITVQIPPYRTDILHPIDIVEDVAIAYGYEKFTPQVPNIYTSGAQSPTETRDEQLRDLLTGQSYTEVMTLILTNKEHQYARMNLPDEDAVETKSSVSSEHTAARTWLLPNLLSVLEKNRNREYPQRIFEIGDAVTPKGKNNHRLAAAVASPTATYSSIQSDINGILHSLKLDNQKPQPYNHKSFIQGRCAKIPSPRDPTKPLIIYGEIHPHVLANFNIETPAAAFEADLDLI